MLPRFEIVRRMRPVALLAPGSEVVSADGPEVDEPAGAVAPYLTVLADLAPGAPGASVGWQGPGVELVAALEGDRVGLRVTTDGQTTRHHSRRHGRTPGADGLAATLTGSQLSAFVREDGHWVVRARVDLRGRVDTHAPVLLGGLRVRGSGAARVRAGRFGWLGLRDLHLATYAEGEPLRHDGALVLTATHAGPGGIPTAHAGVWTFDPATSELRHRSTMFFRRRGADAVYGDHATHLVRDADAWLVAGSTWGDFDATQVRLTTARTSADLLGGVHVLDADPLDVPVDAPGLWDPHLLHHDGEWWLAVTAARRFFDFRPALCRGPTLDALRLVGIDETRRATEGTVLARLSDEWVVLASDGRDNPRGRRKGYGVYDLQMRRVGALDAPYPSNIPWPNVVRDGEGWLLLTFDGTAYEMPDRRGALEPGSHGDVVVMRTVV